eukprot:109634_1
MRDPATTISPCPHSKSKSIGSSNKRFVVRKFLKHNKEISQICNQYIVWLTFANMFQKQSILYLMMDRQLQISGLQDIMQNNNSKRDEMASIGFVNKILPQIYLLEKRIMMGMKVMMERNWNWRIIVLTLALILL